MNPIPRFWLTLSRSAARLRAFDDPRSCVHGGFSRRRSQPYEERRWNGAGSVSGDDAAGRNSVCT